MEIEKRNKKPISNDADIIVERLENIVKELADQIRSNFNSDMKMELALPDNHFFLNVATQVMSEKAISDMTKEKKRLINRSISRARFFDNIRDNGGLFTSLEVSKLLGVSKVTVKKKKDQYKLLSLNLNGEFVYPAFQFSTNDENSNKGVLIGIEEILPFLNNFSDVMKYGFFVQKRNVFDRVLPDGTDYTIVSLLKKGINKKELAVIIRLAKTFGSQDPA
ncbi:hypothetical protein GLP21_19275 [Photobacterium carnosum]|uniref:DNA-binding protein n=3 Tax=Photobacterium iliopiscarium TaxID=56192 RepID=A0ABX5GMA0_9GAMM|nr:MULTISPECIES: hypothetical protein [Photobacterium]MCD9550759.1 hypothetical protein [Photobacterium carnosum]MCF2307816.1 hypothetical protein [Photobacterium carnosum]PSW90489.1 hypothetical protein C9J52_19735 [Photobacterium iliopiscarium]